MASDEIAKIRQKIAKNIAASKAGGLATKRRHAGKAREQIWNGKDKENNDPARPNGRPNGHTFGLDSARPNEGPEQGRKYGLNHEPLDKIDNNSLAQLPMTPEAAALDLDQITRKLFDAAGPALASEAVAPGLADISPIVALIRGGFDLEAEIVPAIKAASSRRRNIGSWNYFLNAIREHVEQTRGIAKSAAAVAQKPANQPAPSIQIGGINVWVDELVRCTAAWMAGDGFGSLEMIVTNPGKENHKIPSHIIDLAVKRCASEGRSIQRRPVERGLASA